jgi:hypothetical protein
MEAAMTDTDRLRDLLERTAPERPEIDPGTRAATVARRGRASRRRDRMLVGGAALVLVTAAVAVPALRADRGDPEPAQPPAVAACPPEAADPSSMTSMDLGDDLAVTVVRVCPMYDPSFGPPDLSDYFSEPTATSPTVSEPSNVLTGDAAAAFMADLRTTPVRTSFACAGVGITPRVIQVQDASGGVQRMYVDGTCGYLVRVGDRDVDIREVIDVLYGNLSRQSFGNPPLECPPPDGNQLFDADTWNGTFDARSATAGIVCQQTFARGGWGEPILGSLDADQLAVVKANLTLPPETDPRAVCPRNAEETMIAVVLASEDDQAAWTGWCSTDSVLSSIRGGWELDAQAKGALHDALTAGGLR